jgi:uncharacterized protein Smg (DUF494 family)
MLKDILGNYSDLDKKMFDTRLEDLKIQISNRFEGFDIEKNGSLIKEFLVLREAIVSKRYSTSEETEMIRVFDNQHTEVIDDEQVGKVLRFITEKTKTPEPR